MNIAKNLNISQYSDFDPVIESVKDLTLKANLKYKKHPSILAIRTKCNRNGVFSFNEIILKQIEKEIRENSDTFSDFVYESINDFINLLFFHHA